MIRFRNGLTMGFALAALVAGVTPLAAQTTSGQPATPPTEVAPAQTAPATTSNTVGPGELQNFNLGSPARRPAPEQAPAATAPPPSAPRIAPAPAQAVPTRSDQPAATRAAPVRAAPEQARPAAAPPPNDVALPSLPQPQVQTPGETAPVGDSPAITPPVAVTPGDRPLWPWLLAGLAALAAIGWFLWKRGQSQAQFVPAVAAPAPAPVPNRPAFPEPRPAAAPMPRAASPEPVRPVPAPAPSPAPVPSDTINARMPIVPAPAASAPAPAPTDTINARTPRSVHPAVEGGIVSRALKPQLAFEFKPIRAELNEAGIALLSFELVVINNGSAPARDVLVETTMINAGASQDEEIANFFRNPVGRGDRIPVIEPMGRMTFRTRVPLTPERLNPIEIEGRKLLVPIVAINALYRFGGGEAQRSASFLVGRGGEDGGKMGPFSLDRGARAWDGLNSRQHSAGLQA